MSARACRYFENSLERELIERVVDEIEMKVENSNKQGSRKTS